MSETIVSQCGGSHGDGVLPPQWAELPSVVCSKPLPTLSGARVLAHTPFVLHMGEGMRERERERKRERKVHVIHCNFG